MSKTIKKPAKNSTQSNRKFSKVGTDWLYDLPRNWQLVQFSHFIDFQEGPGIMAADFREEGVPLLRIKNLKPGYVDLEGCNFLDPEKVEKTWKHFKLQKDDLLISCSASTGLVSVVDQTSANSIAYTGIITLKPKKKDISRVFIKILVSSQIFFEQINLLKTGTTIQHFGPIHLRQIKIPLPPLPEQKAIAAFLEYKTAQIDSLIAKKEALLEKLTEKRTALISQAVTKGLDPNVPMKDSGIEWLGLIPEHWTTGALGYFCQIFSGGTPDRNNSEYWDGDIPWIKTGEVNYQDIYESEEFITNEGLHNSSTSLASPGTLLMAMYGQGNTRGRVAILRIEAAFNQACLAIMPSSKVKTEYLYYYLIAAYEYIRDIGNESSQMNLSSGVISKIRFPVIDRDEQVRIVAYLKQSLESIEQQTAKIKAAIAALKEYRTALITNAVTGKIDVREIAIPKTES